MDTSVELRQGDILWVLPEGSRGRGKVRPVVVVAPNPVALLDEPIATVALTTTFPDPPPAGCIPIPWHPRGHPVTRLNRRTAAICDWIVPVRPSEVSRRAGYVPGLILLEILKGVQDPEPEGG